MPSHKDDKQFVEYRTIREAMRISESTLGISYTFYSDPRLVRLQKDSQTHFVFGYCFDNNPVAAAELVNDKSATYDVLNTDGFSAVPHYLLSNALNPMPSLDHLEGLFFKHGNLVMKPNGGNRGASIAKFDDLKQAFEFITKKPGGAWCASPYVDIAREVRIIVLNGTACIVCEKIEPKVMNGLKMFNLSLGAIGKKLSLSDIDAGWVNLAIQSVEAVGMKMAAVDIVVDQDGIPAILEINDGFGLEHYALSSDEAYAEVVNFYQEALAALFE